MVAILAQPQSVNIDCCDLFDCVYQGCPQTHAELCRNVYLGCLKGRAARKIYAGFILFPLLLSLWLIEQFPPIFIRLFKKCTYYAMAMSVHVSLQLMTSCCMNFAFIIQWIFIPPTSTKLKGGYAGFTLSVCPSVDRIVSALYLQQYLPDPTSEGVLLVMFVSKFKNLKFWQILWIYNFDFVFFWLGIQYESTVWVIMRWRGVSSEHRHSSCSSYLSSKEKKEVLSPLNTNIILRL